MKRIFSLFALAGSLGLAQSAFALGTAANTQIDNTASASFTIEGQSATESSSTVTFFVDEVLDVVVTGGLTELVGTDGTDDTDQVAAFTVSNTGNGPETFDLSVDLSGGNGGDDFDPTSATPTQLYIDDGDGIFDPSVDTPFDPLTDDLALTADQSVVVFVLSDMPAGLNSGDTADIDLTAVANTVLDSGSVTDPVGTTYDNEGEGGVDAVVGSTGASDTDTDMYLVNQLNITLDKEAEKVAGLGTLGLVDAAGVFQVPGDTIRYRLSFSVSGDGTLEDAFITDALPIDLNYETGSIRVVVNSGSALSPTDSNADSDGAFRGVIPAQFPDSGADGIVVDLEQLLGLTELAVTTVPPVSYDIVIEFDMTIPQ